MTIPKIGISLGDPGGIGPEITLKALSRVSSLPDAHYVIFGSLQLLNKTSETLGLNFDIHPFHPAKKYPSRSMSCYDVAASLQGITVGAPHKENGQASFLYFEKAVKEAQKGTIHAIVTAPISKHSWSLARIKWAGHTEYLSQTYTSAIMSFWSKKLKVVLFSHHVSLVNAIKIIKRKNLEEFFLTLNENIQKVGKKKYRFLVSGLNPHAGEEGLLGSEEINEILPAIQTAQKKGLSISGPFPPDIVFRNALNQPDIIVIALYHDQGLIPFKLEVFDQGVNVTLGLPFIRTSPDHGTAFDIAGKGIANPQSMIEAIHLAWDFMGVGFNL